MSKKIFGIGLVMLTSPIMAQNTGYQNTSRSEYARNLWGEPEPRDVDEGQVQVPQDGHVESIPEGHVQSINPVQDQANAQDNLFRLQSRLFERIPSGE
jgi:hypothetical protein